MELDRSSTAVIVVHYLVDVVKHEGAFGEFFAGMVDKTGVVSRTARVIQVARETGLPIVYLRICFRPGYSDLIANNALLTLVEQKGALVDGEPGAEIIGELTPEQGDVVVEHRRHSGFHGSDLKTVLNKNGINTLVVAGVATNVSVEATARHAVDLGYKVVVLEDCCTAASEAEHRASLGTLGLLTSAVATADEFVEALR